MNDASPQIVQQDLIPGTRIQLGKEWYIVPPLNLEGLEKHEQDIEKAQTMLNGAGQKISLREQYTLICSVLLTAMLRNYPNMDLSTLKKIVDLGNAAKVFQAVLGQSGYTQEPGEELASL